jgi:hypothetical protein
VNYLLLHFTIPETTQLVMQTSMTQTNRLLTLIGLQCLYVTQVNLPFPPRGETEVIITPIATENSQFHQLAKANSNAANLTTFISNADHPNAHTQTSTSSATLSTASTHSAQIEPAATQLSAPLLLTYYPPAPKVSEALQKDNFT